MLCSTRERKSVNSLWILTRKCSRIVFFISLRAFFQTIENLRLSSERPQRSNPKESASLFRCDVPLNDTECLSASVLTDSPHPQKSACSSHFHASSATFYPRCKCSFDKVLHNEKSWVDKREVIVWFASWLRAYCYFVPLFSLFVSLPQQTL